MSFTSGAIKFMKLLHIVTRSKKRIGRGHGSGRVKTSGRGTKGQNARSARPIGFEGGQLALTRRLPYLRGKLRNKSRKTKTVALYVGKLSEFSSGSVIDKKVLVKKGFIKDMTMRVKCIGKAKLNKAYTVQIPCSKGSTKTILDAGGKVLVE
jgi:large subunit ribosomal protein L15